MTTQWQLLMERIVRFGPETPHPGTLYIWNASGNAQGAFSFVPAEPPAPVASAADALLALATSKPKSKSMTLKRKR